MTPRWYRLDDEQGLAEAQINLGSMYANGEGIPRDYVQAYAWWNIAAARGNEIAKKNLVHHPLDLNGGNLSCADGSVERFF